MSPPSKAVSRFSQKKGLRMSNLEGIKIESPNVMKRHFQL